MILIRGRYTGATVRILGFVGIEIAVIYMESVGPIGIGWKVFIVIAVPPCAVLS